MSSKTKIFKYLNSKDTLTLAVCESNKPWICNVFYYVDDDLNLYFLSGTDSIHSVYLNNNSLVAASIYDHLSVPGDVSGIQLDGKCVPLSGALLIKHMAKYIAKFPSISKYFENPKEIAERGSKSKIYKITPTFIKLFSNRSNEKVIELKLR